jgi:hypothetical protein
MGPFRRTHLVIKEPHLIVFILIPIFGIALVLSLAARVCASLDSLQRLVPLHGLAKLRYKLLVHI